jgi:CHAD domain-containing protein
VLRDQWRRTQGLLRRLPQELTAGNVHASRVAIRRLRAILAALAPALDPGALARVRRDLKDIAAELGAARDADIRCDILLPRLAGTAAASAVGQRLRAERRAARRRLREQLRSTSARNRLARMSRALNGKSFFLAGPEPDALLAGATCRQCRKLARSLQHSHGSPATRHAMRIRVKKCRYLLGARGIGRHAGGDSRTLARLHELQDCLGELNDLSQAGRWLARQDRRQDDARKLRKALQKKEKQLLAQLARLRRKLRPLLRDCRAGR